MANTLIFINKALPIRDKNLAVLYLRLDLTDTNIATNRT